MKNALLFAAVVVIVLIFVWYLAKKWFGASSGSSGFNLPPLKVTLKNSLGGAVHLSYAKGQPVVKTVAPGQTVILDWSKNYWFVLDSPNATCQGPIELSSMLKIPGPIVAILELSQVGSTGGVELNRTYYKGLSPNVISKKSDKMC